jgi:hypothetical protein
VVDAPRLASRTGLRLACDDLPALPSYAARRPAPSIGLIANIAGTTGLALGFTVTEELTKAGGKICHQSPHRP